ncbi:MAG: tRNA preQ1(34) S-adenosylmethionine ribosyltransferase-isomerase QueA [Pseudomonadota bacterium]
MKLSDFNYKFPEELVAQQPLAERTASKMMVLNRQAQTYEHAQLTDIIKYLNKGDVLILNNSQVMAWRIFGQRSGGRSLELLLVEKTKGEEHTVQTWRCLTKRVRNYHKGDKFFFGISAQAVVKGRDQDFLVVEFPAGHCQRAIERCGVPPLPPYIRKKEFQDYTDLDRQRYQTVYAKTPGSAAAPTAGLHFSTELLQKIQDKGVLIEYVTLHVGMDTFAPVREENIKDHKMHGEKIFISAKTAETVNNAKNQGKKIVAIGTTTVRALEASAKNNLVQAGEQETHLFITPGYEFQIVDAVLTNFHQPKSTLIMLVSAFAGKEFVLNAYQEAIKQKYRLFSYGDCMLLV